MAKGLASGKGASVGNRFPGRSVHSRSSHRKARKPGFLSSDPEGHGRSPLDLSSRHRGYSLRVAGLGDRA